MVLLKDAFGLILKNVTRLRKIHTLARRWVDRVQVVGIKLMYAAGIEIGDGQVGGLGELALQRHPGLNRVGSVQIRIVLVDVRAGGSGSYVRCLRREKELGICHLIFVLQAAINVVAKLLEFQVVRKAVVEHPKARPQHRLGRVFSVAADAPGNTQARCKIVGIAEVVLRFKAQAIAHGNVLPHFPVILNKQARIHERDGRAGRARCLRIETRASALALNVGNQLTLSEQGFRDLVGFDRRDDAVVVRRGGDASGIGIRA